MIRLQVVVTYRKDLLGRLMRWWGLKWSHAAIRYRIDDWPDDMWAVWETAAFGTVRRTWRQFIEGTSEHRLLEMATPLTDLQSEKMLSFCKGAEGKFYNFFALIWIALEYLIGKRKVEALAVRSYVCSSFVAALFEHVGIDLVPGWENIWVTPDDLTRSPLLKLFVEIDLG